MKKIYFLLLIIFYRCGPKYNLSQGELTKSSIPEINVTTQAEIGITLVSKESGYKYEALKITEGRTVRPSYYTKEIKEGDLFLGKYFTKKYNLYESQNDPGFGIAVPKNGGEDMLFILNGGTELVKQLIPIKYTKTLSLVPKKEYLKQEFIYNGKVGNALKFIYREFVDDFARPAFTQDLQYDLAEGNIIGFRGLRIEVLNATNTLIDYKLINQFSN